VFCRDGVRPPPVDPAKANSLHNPAAPPQRASPSAPYRTSASLQACHTLTPPRHYTNPTPPPRPNHSLTPNPLHLNRFRQSQDPPSHTARTRRPLRNPLAALNLPRPPAPATSPRALIALTTASGPQSPPACSPRSLPARSRTRPNRQLHDSVAQPLTYHDAQDPTSETGNRPHHRSARPDRLFPRLPPSPLAATPPASPPKQVLPQAAINSKSRKYTTTAEYQPKAIRRVAQPLSSKPKCYRQSDTPSMTCDRSAPSN